VQRFRNIIASAKGDGATACVSPSDAAWLVEAAGDAACSADAWDAMAKISDAGDAAANRRQLVAAGVAASAVVCLGRDDCSVRVAGACCGALASLVVDAATRASVSSAGAVAAVLTAMRRHGDASVVQQRGCAALSQLCADEDNHSAVTSAGGVETIVTAMRRHESSVAVQEHGCSVLWSLAVGATALPAVIAGGGVDAVVSAMRNHEDVLAVQRNGCGALLTLSLPPGEGIDIEDARASADSRATDAVVASFRLLNREWREHPVRAAIAAAGGIDAVVTAMRCHGGAAAVQELGCRALLRLCLNDANVALAIAAGACDVLAAAGRRLASAVVDEALMLLTSA
jgi:hypothetical protein